jgi:hypothetical protein
VTAWSPPVPVLEKIVALFPALTLNVYSSDEMGNYFVKGTIRASGTDLSDDKEAMAKWEAMMNEPPPPHPGAVTTTTNPARRP